MLGVVGVGGPSYLAGAVGAAIEDRAGLRPGLVRGPRGPLAWGQRADGDQVVDWFAAGRLDALEDAPRPGRPRKLSDEQIETLISRTLEGTSPGGDTHWSTRSMAADQGLNQTQASRIC